MGSKCSFHLPPKSLIPDLLQSEINLAKFEHLRRTPCATEGQARVKVRDVAWTSRRGSFSRLMLMKALRKEEEEKRQC